LSGSPSSRLASPEAARPLHSDSPDLPLYSRFLDLISDRDTYEVHTVKEFDSAYDPARVNVLLRHDVDYSDGLDMATMDYERGFRSTNYLRVYSDLIPTARPEYRIEDVAPAWQRLVNKGGLEIGYHYDVMDETTVGLTRPTDLGMARELFGSNLSYLRGFFDIRTVSAHGGNYNYLYESGEYERKLNLEPFGVVSASFLPFSRIPPERHSYRSDVDGRLEYLRDGLLKMDAGDVVQVLVHPFAKRWLVSVDDPASDGGIASDRGGTSTSSGISPVTSQAPAVSGGRASAAASNLTVSSPSTSAGGIDLRLGFLALAPAFVLALAVWRYKRGLRAVGKDG